MKKRASKPKASKPQPEPINAEGLTPRQLRFVEFYLSGDTAFNGTQSAIRAGYARSGAAVEAVRLLTNAKIAKHVAARLASLQADTDEILTRLTEHARGSLAAMLTPDNILSLKAAREAGALHLIRKAKQKTTRVASPDGGESGEVESELAIELYDAQAALEKLARIRGLLSDLAVSVDLSQFSTAELQRVRDGENPLKVLLSRKTSHSDTPDKPG